MTSNLPTKNLAGTPPTAPTRAQLDLLAPYKNAVELSDQGRFSISDRRMPVGEVREALDQRRAELASSLGSSDPRAVAKRIARLFARFPSSKVNDANIEATIAIYAGDLAVFPMWAIDAACISVITGQEGSATFLPSSIELRKACQRAMYSVHDELSDLERVLDADVYHEPTPEERAKTLADFRVLVDELKLNVDPRDKAPAKWRPPTKDEAQAALDRVDPTRPLPKLSEKALATLGIRPPAQDAAE